MPKYQLKNVDHAHVMLNKFIWPAMKKMLLANKAIELTIKEQTRTLEQNSRMWGMLTDISEQVNWYGKKLSPEDWKHVLTAALCRQNIVPGIDGGFVVLGKSTRKMTKKEMSELQDLIEAFGAQQGVKFKQRENDDEY
jgi:hypothetical protein